METKARHQHPRTVKRNGHMDRHSQNDWEAVRYDPRFDTYSIKSGSAWQELYYCPWCGEKLPPSQRDKWFDELEAKGIEPMNDPYPEDYKTAAWRQRR